MEPLAPRVSVIVPVHNREDLLPYTLDSVRAQTFREWDCIIVDDHSREAAIEVARRYARTDHRVRAVSLPDGKRWASAARNHGLSLARGDFVNFLDSDDLMTPDKLEVQLAEFTADSSPDAVTCRFARFREDPSRDAYPEKFAARSHWLDVIWGVGGPSGGIWQTGCVLWRSSSVRALSGWNEDLHGNWDDCELHLRALLRGLCILWLERVLMFVRTGPQRVSSSGLEKYPMLRRALITGWGHLREAGQVTELRRRVLATRFYYIAAQHMAMGEPARGLRNWFEDCRAIGLGWRWALYGGSLLIVRHNRLLQPLSRRMRPRLFRHLEELPPALPELVDIVPVQSALAGGDEAGK